MDEAEDLTAFSDSYAAARDKFLTLATARQAKLVSVVHPDEKGAEGEDLAIDIAVFGEPEAEKTLLLISGTHGQEGFTGSAIQIAFLRDLDIAKGINVVAVHALNPWGFSHLSRSDENNVDLNRNFHALFDSPPTNEIYSQLHPAVCPADWTSETADWSAAQACLLEAYGAKAYSSALTGGQFDEPTGLNYCGHSPSWSRRTVSRLLPEIMAQARKVAFVEWHTGFGAHGELCHVCGEDRASTAYQRVFEWLGEAASHDMDGLYDAIGGEAPAYIGPFSLWLPTVLPKAACAGLAIEVGTYDIATMGEALRMDRWLRFGEGRSDMSRDDMRRTMVEAFYPKSPQWRAAALAKGCQTQERLMDGLLRW